MSTQIDTARVKEYSSSFTHLVQQMQTKLRGTVIEEDVSAEEFFAEQIGSVEMHEITTRHGPVQYTNTPHSRRKIVPRDYGVADLVDVWDRVRVKIDAGSAYRQAQDMAVKRRYDRSVIAAMDASALTGKEGATSVALPATQILQTTATDAANSGGSATNLTPAKVRRAQFLLDSANVPDDDGLRYFIAGASQKQHLLRVAQVGSEDYVNIKALVEGKITRWLGFNWIWFGSGMLNKSGNVTDCFAYHKYGVQVGYVMGDANVAVLPERWDAVQVKAKLTMGVTRLQEEMVVKVQCDESDTAAPSF